jgi:phytoene dehydrogenase-like protein
MGGEHDALVVGAGPNGLAAAIRLAEAGRSVLVLEAAHAPGGAVRTEALTLPGFLHDTFSAVDPAGAGALGAHSGGPAAAQPQPDRRRRRRR